MFNYQYSSDPHSLPVQELIERAFQLGLNALDTSPYYGPSEEIIGQALQKISFSRDQYYICTKAGRVQLDEFDYSRASVRLSVEIFATFGHFLHRFGLYARYRVC